jgi:hypothetical protein
MGMCEAGVYKQGRLPQRTATTPPCQASPLAALGGPRLPHRASGGHSHAARGAVNALAVAGAALSCTGRSDAWCQKPVCHHFRPPACWKALAHAAQAGQPHPSHTPEHTGSRGRRCSWWRPGQSSTPADCTQQAARAQRRQRSGARPPSSGGHGHAGCCATQCSGAHVRGHVGAGAAAAAAGLTTACTPAPAPPCAACRRGRCRRWWWRCCTRSLREVSTGQGLSPSRGIGCSQLASLAASCSSSNKRFLPRASCGCLTPPRPSPLRTKSPPTPPPNPPPPHPPTHPHHHHQTPSHPPLVHCMSTQGTVQ